MTDAGWGLFAQFVEAAMAPQHRAAIVAATAVLVRWADGLAAGGASLAALRLWQLLHHVTGAPVYATRIAIAYDRLGAPRHAARWLARSDVPSAALPELLAGAQADARAQEQDETRLLQRNLARVRARFPAAADAIAAADDRELTVLASDELAWRWTTRNGSRRDGFPFVVRIAEHSAGERVVALDHPEPPSRLRAQLLANVPANARHAIVGLRAWASVLLLVCNRITTTVPNWSQQLYGVEPEPAVLRRLLRSVDIGPVIDAGLFAQWFVGADASAQALEFFARARLRPLPRVRSACPPALVEGFARLDAARIDSWRESTSALARRYDPMRLAGTLARLDAGAPLRVWLWTSIHTTVLRHVGVGLLAGFEAEGHEVRLTLEQDRADAYDLPAVAQELLQAEPDLALQIDHLRPEYGALLPAGLPVASWILDELPPLSDPAIIARLGTLDLSFAWSVPLAQRYAALGHPHCSALPFAVDPAVYHPRDPVPASDAVAYATHLARPIEPRFAPGLYAALEQRLATMATLPQGHEELAPVLAALLRDTGVTVPAAQQASFAYDALLLARHVERVRVADELLAAGVPLSLFGRGWAEIPRFAPHARGEVAPGPALREMYQRHKVVLHINTRCNLHPRVLEAMASGGFVLARSDGDYDHAPGGVAEALELDRELCLFRDRDDMIAKIRRALGDEPWRQGFVRAGAARVHADHTYRARARSMVAALHQRLRALRSATRRDRAA
ncbi:MAG: glycosyltransferase [Nannocystaceae bacterium]